MARRRFSMGGPYFSFEQTENAMRAERINKLLDEGIRVLGDDGPDSEGTWHEIEEAVIPYGNGIDVRTKAGKIVRIYSMDASDGAAVKHNFT